MVVSIGRSKIIQRPRETTPDGQPITPSQGKLSASFLGLTQSCRQVRSEFRMWWLSTTTVLLCDVQPYFRAFIETPRTPMKEAFKTFQAAGGSLRIRGSLCSEVDLVPMLKLKAIHPEIHISFEWEKGPLERCSKPFDSILTNRNSTWLRWITSGTLKVARVTLRSGPRLYIRLVLRKQHLDTWLGPHQGSSHRISHGDLVKVGLPTDQWNIVLGILD
jgi:hypothetical protein